MWHSSPQLEKNLLLSAPLQRSGFFGTDIILFLNIAPPFHAVNKLAAA
jgi:hypothetical protein